MTTHLVSLLDVKDFGAEFLRIGDLNGDGAPDLLFIQSDSCTRDITCLTATDLLGKVLWQTGAPSPENGYIYSDLPVQIYDWDGDGVNEVLWIEQAIYVESLVFDSVAGRHILVPTTRRGELKGRKGWGQERAERYAESAIMHVLDGTTGKEKARFDLPAPADDCFLFVDLTGRGRREDLVVKDRYWNMWGISHDGQVLWHYAKCNPGHFPAVADVDVDGRDEVFIGWDLVDHDGTSLWTPPAWNWAHQDAAYIVQLPDGTWRLLFGNHGIHCLTLDGTELWSHPLAEAQHVVAGHFRPDLGPVQFMVIDRGQARAEGGRGPATLYQYDLDGREVWRREQPQGSWGAAEIEIDWSGAKEPREVLVYNRGPGQPAIIYDGAGNVVDSLHPQYPPYRKEDRKTYYCLRADVWGDSREEVLFSGPQGACIWANARPLAVPTLYNNTLYSGM